MAEIIVRTATGSSSKANLKSPAIEPEAGRSRHRLFYGWFVVVAAAVGMLLGAAPIVVFSFGVFLKPLTEEFHAGRAAVSLAITILNFSTAMGSTLVGFLCDRIGARRVALSGMLLLALCLMSARIIGARLWELYIFYAVVGAVTPATTTVPYSMVVSRWFNRQRGLALGLMMLGLGVGAVVMPPLFQYLIGRVGWRSAYVVAGAVVLLFLPKENKNAIRWVANLFALAGFVVSLPLVPWFWARKAEVGWKFVEGGPNNWIPTIGSGYYLGIDGISFLAVIVALLLMSVAPRVRRQIHHSVLRELKDGFKYAFGFVPARGDCPPPIKMPLWLLVLTL